MTSNANRKKAQDLIKMARITEPSVDVNKIASLLDFTVVPYPLHEKRKATLFIEGKEVRVIGVNNSYSINAQRYSVAHELGHFVNGHQRCEKSFAKDETRFYSSDFHQEKEADLFASELLMPRDFLIKDVAETGLEVQKLAELYEVSEQAMRIRLKSLNFFERFSYKN